jgi:hypothetical protein
VKKRFIEIRNQMGKKSSSITLSQSTHQFDNEQHVQQLRVMHNPALLRGKARPIEDLSSNKKNFILIQLVT